MGNIIFWVLAYLSIAGAVTALVSRSTLVDTVVGLLWPLAFLSAALYCVGALCTVAGNKLRNIVDWIIGKMTADNKQEE